MHMLAHRTLQPIAYGAVHFLTPCIQQLQSCMQSGQQQFSSAAPAHQPSTAKAPTQQPQQRSPPKHLDFNDYAAIFRTRSTMDLLRTYLVLKVCSINPLVSNADMLVRTSRKLLGDTITFGVLRHSFFKQFCAGETDTDIWPTINMLRANGIGAIIDYAAEDDEASDSRPQATTAAAAAAAQGAACTGQAPSSTAAVSDGSGSNPGQAAASKAETMAVGRMYNYEDEATCDKHVGIFLKAIDTVAQIPGEGFAAIKVTALGSTQLLQRMSAALSEIRTLFKEADTDGDGFVDQQEFEALYLQLFPHSPPDRVQSAFSQLDLEGNGRVDIISWSHRIHLADMPAMVQRIRKHGTKTRLSDQLLSVALTEEEVELANALLGRVSQLAAAAVEKRVKLMIDAEHTYFQPAIDHTAHVLSLQYNKEFPAIFNTYQAYLKGSYTRLQEDVERARRERYIFAAKLVRGAYVKLERARAARLGYESPIWDTIEQTHINYDQCLDAVLDEVVAHHAQLMVASHNQSSVERTVAGMASRHLAPSGSGVYFGQLLGMSDNLTFTLGQNGYEAFKYVPYGTIQLVMPYLIRRAHENSAIMGAGVGKQIAMLQKELWRRLTHRLQLFKASTAAGSSLSSSAGH